MPVAAPDAVRHFQLSVRVSLSGSLDWVASKATLANPVAGSGRTIPVGPLMTAVGPVFTWPEATVTVMETEAESVEPSFTVSWIL